MSTNTIAKEEIKKALEFELVQAKNSMFEHEHAMIACVHKHNFEEAVLYMGRYVEAHDRKNSIVHLMNVFELEE